MVKKTDFISNEQEAILSEFMSIGYGEIHRRLNKFMDKKIEFNAPQWTLCKEADAGQFLQNMPDKAVIINQSFKGAYSGNGFLIIEREDALKLASILLEEKYDPNAKLNADHKDALKEIGNISINGLVCSADNFLQDDHEFEVPSCFLGMPKNILNVYNYGAEGFPILVMYAGFVICAQKIKITFGLMIEKHGINVLADKLSASLSKKASCA